MAKAPPALSVMAFRVGGHLVLSLVSVGDRVDVDRRPPQPGASGGGRQTSCGVTCSRPGCRHPRPRAGGAARPPGGGAPAPELGPEGGGGGVVVLPAARRGRPPL